LTGVRRKTLLRASLAFASCVCIAGCAFYQPSPPKPETAALLPGEILSAQAAKGTISIGKSTKSDVTAALGQAIVINFDSGYEVWVYREKLQDKAPPLRTEFVLLFAPSGIVTKSRIR
jgi:hypothetical protein